MGQESLTELKRELRSVGDDPELFALHARNIRQFYEALLDVGFTAEQALVIAANHGIASAV